MPAPPMLVPPNPPVRPPVMPPVIPPVVPPVIPPAPPIPGVLEMPPTVGEADTCADAICGTLAKTEATESPTVMSLRFIAECSVG
ncbi:MAG: hypothetical protein FJ308_06040 [Planctomycetes bacterium]|nr:hypothetical protein [Planctomycetota bacterium]